MRSVPTTTRRGTLSTVDLARTLERGYAATRQAIGCLEGASAAEAGLVRALAARFPSANPPAITREWNEAYASAMRDVYADHPEDLDVTALFADALLNVTPWQLWDLRAGQPAAGAYTSEAVSVLERSLSQREGRAHPGVLHTYIHLMEMSPQPERALPAADWLRGLVPDGGHLEHMPTHIDVLCGDYRSVIASNSRAIAADDRFAAREGAMNFYTLYRAHNYHFKIYGAMFLGQGRGARSCRAP
jgi:hypothetical protein